MMRPDLLLVDVCTGEVCKLLPYSYYTPSEDRIVYVDSEYTFPVAQYAGKNSTRQDQSMLNRAI